VGSAQKRSREGRKVGGVEREGDGGGGGEGESNDPETSAHATASNRWICARPVACSISDSSILMCPRVPPCPFSSLRPAATAPQAPALPAPVLSAPALPAQDPAFSSPHMVSPHLLVSNSPNRRIDNNTLSHSVVTLSLRNSGSTSGKNNSRNGGGWRSGSLPVSVQDSFSGMSPWDGVSQFQYSHLPNSPARFRSLVHVRITGTPRMQDVNTDMLSTSADARRNLSPETQAAQ
jgi:hypothetical protein